MKEIEMKKMHLEQEQRISPLKPHWVKVENLTPCEAILVYYKVEPSMNHFTPRDVQIINAIDCQGIYAVLMSSEFIKKSPHYFKQVDFIKWVISKGFEIPDH